MAPKNHKITSTIAKNALNNNKKIGIQIVLIGFIDIWKNKIFVQIFWVDSLQKGRNFRQFGPILTFRFVF